MSSVERHETHEPVLSLQQQVLAYAILYRKTDVTTAYTVDARGVKNIAVDLPPDGFQKLVERFKKDPKDCLALARENLFAISRDPRQTAEKRERRIRRYVDAYCDLQIALDHAAFPSSDVVRSGVPEYIPDGLSDMGSEASLDGRVRSRERIRVDKAQMFRQSKDLLCDVFSLRLHGETTVAKQYMVERVAHFVHTQLPYDQTGDPFKGATRSIRASEALENKSAVCRHQALYAQVLMQTFGLTSRLMKSVVELPGEASGAHANNLVRINGIWNILDVTNPDTVAHKSVIYMKPIPDTVIDFSRKDYTWKVPSGNGPRTYTSRNTMHYRIRDNSQT